ncbi:MAG: DNA recombination protein RmuC [Hyphomonadaceae bacterium]
MEALAQFMVCSFMVDLTPWTLFVLALGGAAYFFWRWQGVEARDLLAQARLKDLSRLEAEREAQRERADELARQLAAETARAAERERAHEAARADMEKNFENVANRALGQSQQSFLALAKETFEKHQQSATGGVKEIVGPVQEQFAKLSETIAALDKARTEDKSALSEQMRQLNAAMSQTQNVTGKLANALRAGPKTRGRWGEETLKNVLELSGLSSKIDFVAEQSTQDGEGGRLRPDVVINLPGGRCIVVDSKVALSGYLDAMEATDDLGRDTLLKRHAQELRGHMKGLASKEYWRHVPATADFVIMFVPGDNFLAAAFEHDPALYQDGFRERVVIIGPSNLFALAKTIAFGWRQEEIQKNADEIAKLGRDLFDRLAVASKHLASLGDAVGKSVGAYNQFVSSFDTRVMVTARRFKELGASEGAKEIVSPAMIEAAPRAPTAQTEFEFTATPPRLKRTTI